MKEPDWGLNLRICAMINSEELNGTEIVKAIKKEISSSKNTIELIRAWGESDLEFRACLRQTCLAKILKDVKETVQECVSEFISFIIGEVSDKCQREKRKTINDDDLMWTMTTLGFEKYVEPL